MSHRLHLGRRAFQTSQSTRPERQCGVISSHSLLPSPPGITFPRYPRFPTRLYAPPVPSCRGAASRIRRRSSRRDRRPRRRNPSSGVTLMRVRPPSRGAVRETRRHYDRLCVWRTLRASGQSRPGNLRATGLGLGGIVGAAGSSRGTPVRPARWRAKRMATSRWAGALEAPIFGPPKEDHTGATDAPATLGILPGTDTGNEHDPERLSPRERQRLPKKKGGADD